MAYRSNSKKILLCTLICFYTNLCKFCALTDTDNFITRVQPYEIISNVPPLCSSSCSVNISNTILAQFCLTDKSLKLQDRCCVNVSLPHQFEIIGIDLQQCNLTEANFSEGIVGINTLQYIYLEGNAFSALNNTDFHGNTGIQNLSLSQSLECPGGEQAWENKFKVDNTSILCWRERNPCSAEQFCPPHSYCVHTGIDLSECLCEEDYHGYKCLNKGQFPTVPFSIGISVTTVITCVFFWFTQRRYVKNSSKKK